MLQSTTDIHDIQSVLLREQPLLATANCVANLQWKKADGLFWEAHLLTGGPLFRLNIRIPTRATHPSFVVRTGLTGGREPRISFHGILINLIQDESKCN